MGCRAPPPRFFLARPYLRPIDRESKIFLLTVWPEHIGHRVLTQTFRRNGLILAEFRFFCVFRPSGVRALVFFSGTPKRPKMPKNRIWGPVEAVSGKFSGDLKVARGVSATDEPKNPDFEPLSPSYAANTGSRARRRWGLCQVT